MQLRCYTSSISGGAFCNVNKQHPLDFGWALLIARKLGSRIEVGDHLETLPLVLFIIEDIRKYGRQFMGITRSPLQVIALSDPR